LKVGFIGFIFSGIAKRDQGFSPTTMCLDTNMVVGNNPFFDVILL